MKHLFWLAALLFPLPGAALASGPSGKNAVHAHSLSTGVGVSSCYRFSVRVADKDAVDVQWKICVTSGFTPIMPLSGPVVPDAFGWDDVSVPFSPPVGLCPGDRSNFTVKLCVDGQEVASKAACINLVGSKAGATYVAAEPLEPYVFIGNRGRRERIAIVVPNDEPDFLPHAYDFLLETQELAPGLDLYELTPVSGFDLPTVVGAGTPLLTGKLEEIPPGQELLVEIDVQPTAGQQEGDGNDVLYTIFDDDTPAESFFSSALVVRCHAEETEATATPRTGSGSAPVRFTSLTAPALGRTWRSAVDTTAWPAARGTLLVATAAPLASRPLSIGELLIDLDAPPVLADLAIPLGGRALHAIAIPRDPALEGLRLHAQAAVLGPPVELQNALDLVLAPVVVTSRCTFARLSPGAMRANE